MNTNTSTRWQKILQSLKKREVATALPLGRKSAHSPELLEARIAPAFGAVVELGALTGSDGFKLSGVAVGDSSGGSVSGAGDINGDGIDDLIIGASDADPSYVVFGQLAALAPDIAVGGKSATFTDVDGDLVTVKTTKGTFGPTNFNGFQTGVTGGGQLQSLTLDAGFAGAAITITATPGILGGNGFVNIGHIDADGVDLGAITLPGDLGRITAGTIGGDAKVPAIKSLTVQSIGLLGLSTQGSVASHESDIEGALAKLTVKGDLRGKINILGATDGSLGSATIGGSIVSGEMVEAGIYAAAAIGAVKIGGDIRTSSTASAIILASGPLGTIAVGGSLVGQSGNRVVIEGFGQLTAPAKGVDLGIKSVTVKGSVEHADIFAGVAEKNADASIGSISVGGDWIASSAVAGFYTSGVDNVLFTADDALASFFTAPERDSGIIVSSIGSFTVAGQAFGTASDTGDMFGVLAEQIGKAKVGTRTFALKANTNLVQNREAFFAAPTLTGAGAELPAFDFIIREFGSPTPAVALGGANLDISTDGKTATFTDVDGDLVTVKRTAGGFVPGDFTITTAASGGGLLEKLVLTAAPNNVAFNLSITAKPGPGGGNGFVNVGQIEADTTDLTSLTVGGELHALDVGDATATKPGIAALTVHSLGNLGGNSFADQEIDSAHGIGKITVKTDIRSTGIYANNIGGGLLGLTVGGSIVNGVISSDAGIGAIKVTGSVRSGGQIYAETRIGSIAIGGDLADISIEALANSTNPAKGPDIALKSLTVGGNIANTTVRLGDNFNADASLGTVSVGREWLASMILAGTDPGLDTFIGTTDDTKTIGVNDIATRFSTIASIVIKGQAFGSTASDDHFGIVAEVIGKAKVGTRTYAFKAATKEAFVGAPGFDWFLREIA